MMPTTKRVKRSLTNSFNGNVSSFDSSSKQAFALSIENKSSGTLRFVVFTGLLNTKAEIQSVGGLPCDYILTDGVIKDATNNIIAVASASNLDYLRRHLNSNPTAITNLQITAKDQAQLSQPIVFKRVSPYRNFGEQRVVPIQHQSAKDANTLLINLDVKEMILGDQSLFAIDVAPGNFISLTMNFGQAFDSFESAVSSDLD